MPPKKTVDLAKKAKEVNKTSEKDSEITQAVLVEFCPKEILARFKAAKTPAAKADLLYMIEHNELKKARDAYNKIDAFTKKLEAWFVQEFEGDQKGVTGKVGRVEVKDKEIASVEDWEKVYAHIVKKKEFELLNKAINQKAVKERWEQKKDIPGIGRFIKKVVSLTAAKGAK